MVFPGGEQGPREAGCCASLFAVRVSGALSIAGLDTMDQEEDCSCGDAKELTSSVYVSSARVCHICDMNVPRPLITQFPSTHLMINMTVRVGCFSVDI